MRVTSLGHAALYIETGDQRVLVDPVFAGSLMGGAVAYHPARALELAKMPAPTAIVVTHGHFDHFHAPSLAGFDRNLPLIVPGDHELLAGLDALGFRNLQICAPWDTVTLGRTIVVPTPSGHEEPEFGVLIGEGGTNFWHMADSEVTPADGLKLRARHGSIDVVSVKYQPVVRSSMGHLRSRGASFDHHEVVAWLETACAVEPAFAFPYASGLCFAGRHAWFNRFAFAYSPEEIARLLERRLGEGRSGVMAPGDVIAVTAGETPRRGAQAASFVCTLPSPAIAWEPVDVSTLAGLEDADSRGELARRLDEFIAAPFLPWLRAELASTGSPWRTHCMLPVIWQLVVEAGDGIRIERHVDFGAQPIAVGSGRHAHANAFTHVSGRGLLAMLRGEEPGILLWLAGEARSYDKAIGVIGNRLTAAPSRPPEDEPGDPLSYFLRRFGPGSTGTISPPAPEPDLTQVLEVMARPGENDDVAVKKALLSLLACREAERLGLPLDAEVQATADWFRTTFGLEEADATWAWLAASGLDLPRFTEVMRGFTAVRLVQAHAAAELEPLADSHARVASIRDRES